MEEYSAIKWTNDGSDKMSELKSLCWVKAAKRKKNIYSMIPHEALENAK